MDSSYSKTLTFVVSGAMVMGSLQAAAQRSAQLGAPCHHACDSLGQPAAFSTPAGDDASPLSSSSRFVALQTANSITPTSGLQLQQGANSLGAAPADLQQQQQQQQHLLGVQVQQQAAQKLHPLQFPLQQQQQQREQLLGYRGGLAGQQQQQAPGSKWSRQQQQQQVLLLTQQQHQLLLQQQQPLMPQSSGGSFSSASSSSCSLQRSSLPGGSGDSFSSGAITATANSMAWQQLLKHQQLQLVQQPAGSSQQVRLVPAGRTLPSSSSALGKRTLAAGPSSYDQLYPAAKKAASSAAMAAMLQASLVQPWQPAGTAQQQQQQLGLPVSGRQQVVAWQQAARPQLPPTGLLRQRQQQLSRAGSSNSLSLVGATVAVPVLPGPMRLLEPAQQKLLQWAGRVLNCHLQDAYLLCSHLYGRVAGQLDDMLLISLGVTASSQSVTMLVSLWVASKLEGHRRQVAGASKLAAALQLLPGSITDIELHIMQRLNWQPYAGWSGRLLE
jgi:hypothetical protein